MFSQILLFFHIYPLHALVYGLKLILEKKMWKLLKNYTFNNDGPFKNHIP
jgi:hypothetical protein